MLHFVDKEGDPDEYEKRRSQLSSMSIHDGKELLLAMATTSNAKEPATPGNKVTDHKKSKKGMNQ